MLISAKFEPFFIIIELNQLAIILLNVLDKPEVTSVIQKSERSVEFKWSTSGSNILTRYIIEYYKYDDNNTIKEWPGIKNKYKIHNLKKR